MVNFSPNGCIFQDMLLGKGIGSGKEVDGLFILEKHCVMTKGIFQEQDRDHPQHSQFSHPQHSQLGDLLPKASVPI